MNFHLSSGGEHIYGSGMRHEEELSDFILFQLKKPCPQNGGWYEQHRCFILVELLGGSSKVNATAYVCLYIIFVVSIVNVTNLLT